jgi:hypothetical protein
VTTSLKGIVLWTVGALAIMIPLSRATLPHLGILSLVAVGQNVIVYYASADPNESWVGIPGELVKNEIAPIITCGYHFPGLRVDGLDLPLCALQTMALQLKYWECINLMIVGLNVAITATTLKLLLV